MLKSDEWLKVDKNFVHTKNSKKDRGKGRGHLNRTFEVVLGIIGMVADLGMAVIGVLSVFLLSFGFDGLFGAYPALEPLSQLFQVITVFIWIPIVSCAIGGLLAGIATYQIAGDKRPKLAGGLFIAAALLSSWLLFTLGVFQSILYVIAAIMCFVRREDEPSHV